MNCCCCYSSSVCWHLNSFLYGTTFIQLFKLSFAKLSCTKSSNLNHMIFVSIMNGCGTAVKHRPSNSEVMGLPSAGCYFSLCSTPPGPIIFCQICAFYACFATSWTDKHPFCVIKISSRTPPRGTWLSAHYCGIEREEKIPVPGRNQTHDLKSFAPPLRYNRCPTHPMLAAPCWEAWNTS